MLNQPTSLTTDYDKVAASALAPNTRRAYDRAWAEFVRYCHAKGFAPLEATPEQVADFLVWAAQSPRPQSTRSEYLAMGSLQVLKSAINRKFLDANKPSPTRSGSVDTVMRGLTRIKGHKPRQVKALRERHIMQILEKIDDRIDGLLASDIPKPKISRLFRDASLISLGFAGALRRSELIELKVADIQQLPGYPPRMLLKIQKSKTDQEGQGQTIPILEGDNIQPISRLREWLDVSGIQTGYIYQTMRRGGTLRGNKLHTSDVPRLLKHYSAQIGLNPADIAGHSLRAGFVTSAAAHKAPLYKIMEVTRHTQPATVMKYIRDTELFTDHAGLEFL